MDLRSKDRALQTKQKNHFQLKLKYLLTELRWKLIEFENPPTLPPLSCQIKPILAILDHIPRY